METAVILIVFASSVLVAGELAKRRGRSFKIWAWIGAIIGPLAIPLLFVFARAAPPRGSGGESAAPGWRIRSEGR
jgi:hypothetical protein